jgi:hypothetical protein
MLIYTNLLTKRGLSVQTWISLGRLLESAWRRRYSGCNANTERELCKPMGQSDQLQELGFTQAPKIII